MKLSILITAPFLDNSRMLVLCLFIILCRGDLSEDQHGVLRHQLFKSLAQYSSGPNLMLIQLSKALVSVAFQTLPDRWPNTIVSSIHSLKKACETVEVRAAWAG